MVLGFKFWDVIKELGYKLYIFIISFSYYISDALFNKGLFPSFHHLKILKVKEFMDEK